MKHTVQTTKLSFIIFLLFFSLNLISQQTSISLNPGYQNQVFYSMQNGEVLNVANDNWDLAFSTDMFSSTVRTNDGKGVEAYSYILGDTSAWNDIDNSYLNSLPSLLFNSDTNWQYGAFDKNQTGGFDYGWGVYNLQTHQIIGDSIYIIKTVNNNWKKLLIKNKIAGNYLIKYSNMDGSNLVEISIPASNYADKNFIYFSLDNELILDREPNKNDWDITFTKYMTLYPTSQGSFMPYSVTGVLQNYDIEVAKADNITSPLTYNNYSLHSFSNTINVIGFDWKTFQGSYVVSDDLCYFVNDQSNNIWRITFTNFEGMSTGDIEFNKELIANTNTNNINLIDDFNIFPIPANKNENITILLNLKSQLSPSIINVSDITGKEIYKIEISNTNLNTHIINTQKFERGVYLISLYVDGLRKTKRIVIH